MQVQFLNRANPAPLIQDVPGLLGPELEEQQKGQACQNCFSQSMFLWQAEINLLIINDKTTPVKIRKSASLLQPCTGLTNLCDQITV